MSDNRTADGLYQKRISPCAEKTGQQKIAAGLIFLVLSAKIFSVYVSSPNQYERNFSKLSVPEKSMVNQMKKTGEIQSKMIGPRRATGGNGKFLDEVEKNHRRDKKH